MLPDPDLKDKVIGLVDGRPLTHAQIVRQVQAWHDAFLAQSGDTVAMYFDDVAAFIPALFGAWHAGKVVVLLADRQPATLLRVAAMADLWVGSLEGSVTPCEPGPGKTSSSMTPLSPTHTKLTLFTSGSTGEPEAILKRLQQLDAEVRTLQDAFGRELDQEEPAHVYSSVSHQHIYGLLFHVLWPLAAGHPIVCERFQYPEELVARISGAASAVLVSSPALLTRLPHHLDWSSVKRALRAVFSAGSALEPEDSRDCRALLGISPTEVLGSSETGGIAWRRIDNGHAWTPFSCVQWRSDRGLLLVRSPYLPVPTSWYTTADRVVAVAHANTEGPRQFLLQGRADRLVKIADKRVSLSAIERVLKSCPEVEDARVVALPQKQGSDTLRVAAGVQLSEAGWSRLAAEGRRSMSAHLTHLLKPHVVAVALPRRWRYVETLPVNAQGKITFQALQTLFKPWLPDLTWDHCDETTARAKLFISAELLAFDGHFPDAPVLPGVVQLHWVQHYARARFTLPNHFLRMEALKFQDPILPGRIVDLRMTWSAEKGTLSFRFESQTGPHSSGRLVYGVPT